MNLCDSVGNRRSRPATSIKIETESAGRLLSKENKSENRRDKFIKTTYDISLDSQIPLLPLTPLKRDQWYAGQILTQP